MRREQKKGQKDTGNMTLPLAAFRLSMLDGTLAAESPEAVVYNIPPNRQPPHEPLPEMGVVPSIDYLSLMWLGSDLSEGVREVQQYGHTIFDREDFKSYESEVGTIYRARGSRGSLLEYRAIPGEGYCFRLNLPGDACRGIGLEAASGLLRWLFGKPGGHCTRIDINCDDTAGFLCLDRLSDDLRAGNFSGYKCGEVIESVGGKKAGKTVYFGGKKSLQRIRFYDKAAESGLDYACIRQEVQYRGARSEEVARTLIEGDYISICRKLLGRISGSIIMGSRPRHHANRIKAADYWVSWRDFLSHSVIGRAPIKRFRSVARTVAWMKRSISKSIAKLSVALDSKSVYDFCLYLCKKGSDKLKEYDFGDIQDWIDTGGKSELEAEISGVSLL